MWSIQSVRRRRRRSYGRNFFFRIDPEINGNVSISTEENAYIQYSKATKERFDEIEKQKLEENSGKEKDEDTF